jgi:hypothetical protein
MKLKCVWIAGALVALSVGARAEVFYTINESTDTLYKLDTSTLTLTPVGPLGVLTDFGDLAYDSSTGTMYLSNGWGQGLSVPSSLYKVDLTTGAATLIGNMGQISMFGLVYDPVTNKLYGSQSTTASGVFEINKSTGAATFIGNPGGISLDGLTYVGSTGDIAGLYAGPGSLHKINPANGSATLLSGGGGFVNNCGIAWGAASNKIYSVDWSGDVYSFDVAGAYARTTLGNLGNSYDGLASTEGCGSTTYCTAKINSLGCTPSIGSTGAASATLTSGFVIKGTSVRNNKNGLLFYGVTGRATTPFQGGTLCVNSPIKRTGSVNSGGNPLPANDCSGVYSMDMNAFAHSSGPPIPLPALIIAGTVVNCQWWGRDPGFPAPNNTTLTNGLEYTVCP